MNNSIESTELKTGKEEQLITAEAFQMYVKARAYAIAETRSFANPG